MGCLLRVVGGSEWKGFRKGGAKVYACSQLVGGKGGGGRSKWKRVFERAVLPPASRPPTRPCPLLLLGREEPSKGIQGGRRAAADS